jgi:MoaA/NifB/PqqE/SkfB family radical SAM enzyme
MSMPLPPAQSKRLSSWGKRLAGVPRTFFYLLRNARHIQQLIRAPQTIGPDAAASLVRTVNLLIEQRCNIRCSCCHYFKAYDSSEKGPEFNLPRLMTLIDEVPQANVAISGGEPLMSPARVVDTARALLGRQRETAIVTNGLPLAEGGRSKATREVLLNGLSRLERGMLRVRVSVDIEHRDGGRLGTDEYVKRCHSAIEFLTASGFSVYTRSIVTTPEEYRFYREYVLPLTRTGVTKGASVQPDMYALHNFHTALRRGELGDVAARLGAPYIGRIAEYVSRDADERPDSTTSALRTAPWVLIEVNARGVKGPSGFLPGASHHGSVIAMLRSYDWLRIADSMVPQITISRNALPYRINRRNRAVSVNFPHLLGRLLSR